MKRRMIVLGFVAAVASGCGPSTTSTSQRPADDVRNTRVDTPHDSQGQGGGADMPGKGRGGEHRPEKH